MAKTKKKNKAPQRKAKKEVDRDLDTLKPIDPSILGSDDDPCFGKLYDLSESECQRCGDSEFCSIAFAQQQNITRKKIEKKNDFKDIQDAEYELSDDKNKDINEREVLKYMRKLKRRDNEPKDIRKKTRKKFKLDIPTTKELYKQIK